MDQKEVFTILSKLDTESKKSPASIARAIIRGLP